MEWQKPGVPNFILLYSVVIDALVFKGSMASTDVHKMFIILLYYYFIILCISVMAGHEGFPEIEVNFIYFLRKLFGYKLLILLRSLQVYPCSGTYSRGEWRVHVIWSKDPEFSLKFLNYVNFFFMPNL